MSRIKNKFDLVDAFIQTPKVSLSLPRQLEDLFSPLKIKLHPNFEELNGDEEKNVLQFLHLISEALIIIKKDESIKDIESKILINKKAEKKIVLKISFDSNFTFLPQDFFSFLGYKNLNPIKDNFCLIFNQNIPSENGHMEIQYVL